jgi:hypothetical protein
MSSQRKLTDFPFRSVSRAPTGESAGTGRSAAQVTANTHLSSPARPVADRPTRHHSGTPKRACVQSPAPNPSKIPRLTLSRTPTHGFRHESATSMTEAVSERLASPAAVSCSITATPARSRSPPTGKKRLDSVENPDSGLGIRSAKEFPVTFKELG